MYSSTQITRHLTREATSQIVVGTRFGQLRHPRRCEVAVSWGVLPSAFLSALSQGGSFETEQHVMRGPARAARLAHSVKLRASP